MRRLIMQTVPWSFYDLNTYMKQGTVTYNHSSQRGLKWDKKRKTKLIDSILNGIFIGTFICNKVGSNYDVLDGKQRGNTVAEFINNGFQLSGEVFTQFNDGTEMEISGYLFSDLPEELQQRILNYNLVIYFYENLTEAESAEIIERANNGKPMTGVEKARIGSASLATYNDMGTHPLFENILSRTARNGFADAEIIAKTWIMLYSERKCFDKDVFNEVMQKTIISDAEKTEILRIYDYAFTVYGHLTEEKEDRDALNFAKKVFKKIHFLSLIPFMKDAMEENIPVDDFSIWLKTFFETDDKQNASVDDNYNRSCKGGTGHEASINGREYALKVAYDDMFHSAAAAVAEAAMAAELIREPISE